MKRARPHDSHDPLRLALSHREKARALSQAGQEAHQKGRIDGPRFRTLQEFYANHYRRAEEKLRYLRGEHARRAEKIRAEIQETARMQMELGDRVNEREMTIDRANTLSRQYGVRLAELRAAYAEEQRRAQIDNVDELGGLIDLPLDQYDAEPAVEAPAPVAVGTSWVRIVATALALLASLSVFLPWQARPGEARTLGGVLGAWLEGRAVGSPGAVATALLVVYLAAPLVAAVFAWLESPRRGGRGMATAGVAVAVLALLGIAAAAAVTDDRPGAGLAAVRIGAPAYLVAGIALAVLGIRRTRRADEPAEGRSHRGGMAVAALAVVALGVWVFYGLRFSESSVTVEIGAPDADTGVVEALVANAGPSTVRVYLPWPEGTPESPLVESRRDAVGALVYLREAGVDEFRAYPASEPAWEMRGALGTDETALEMPAGESRVVRFHPQRLRSEGIEPEMARVVFTDGRGRELGSFQVLIPAP